MKLTQKQGPLRNVDVLDLLAWENNRVHSQAAENGRHPTDGYYQAWRWLTGEVIDRPSGRLEFHAKRCLVRVQTCSNSRSPVNHTL